MNDLEKYFLQNTGGLMNKWKHYFEIYDRHLSKYRGTDVHVVEFGVFHGGSLQMWKDYFGAKAKIYGIDINPDCQQLEAEQIKIIIGDQENREFLRSLTNLIPRIDVLIDDGGHTMKQQINTFEELFPSITQDGVYLCEDLHTSYWYKYGGGYQKSDTFIEYSKNLIDYLNAWHSWEPKKLKVSDFTKSAYSLSYYDSVLVIEKRPIQRPNSLMTGHPQISDFSEIIPSSSIKLNFLQRCQRWLRQLNT